MKSEHKTRAVLLFGLCCATGLAAVPNPTVIGPIPARATPGNPSHDYPFFSATIDLASYRYIEEEFFLEGVANRYNTPALATGSVIDGGHPYRTRLIVRRPLSWANFNGTALMELQNVAANYDFDAAWLASHDHFLRRGYAWIGVSAQQAGVHSAGTGLKAWSPARYGSLDVTQGGTILDDALSYDILSQAAQAVRNPVGIDPMGGLQTQRIFAIGVSQAAGRLVTYHNSIHPLAGVFDAFLVVEGGAQLRTDLTAKVFKLLTESEVSGSSNSQAPLRQPDSDHFRRWEVAGSAHLDAHIAQELGPLLIRDLSAIPPSSCDLPPFSRVPLYFVANAIYDHVVDWVTHFGAPPAAPEIQLQSQGPPVVIARDTDGNALGGIRLATHAVPMGVNTGVNSGPGFCKLYGTYRPFDDAMRHGRYADHTTYVTQIIQATLDNLKAGFIVPEDASAVISDAALFNMSGVAMPDIAAGGVLDPATYTPGPVAPNTVVSIFGFNLATVTALARETRDGYPTNLFGTRVAFGPFADAPLIYISPTQINAVVPTGLTPGNYNVAVTVYGAASRAQPVTVTAPAGRE